MTTANDLEFNRATAYRTSKAAQEARHAARKAIGRALVPTDRFKDLLREVDLAARDCLLGPTKLASHDQAVRVNGILLAIRVALTEADEAQERTK